MSSTTAARPPALRQPRPAPSVERPEPRPAARSPYLFGRLYDWVFFLAPPVAALAIGIAISGTGFAERPVRFGGGALPLAAIAMGILVHAHLVAVFFRSHANPAIFQRHRARFLVVPVLLFAAVWSSNWALIGASVLATFWDVYHSGAQTFGFARIYDARAGNDPRVGRRLDFWLNQVLYAGPILAGATLMDHVGDFQMFERVGSVFFTSIPVRVEGFRATLTWVVALGGTAFVLYYLAAWRRIARAGYRVSPLKIWLVASTGLCSVWTWGFNSFGVAFFVMNLFHAVQYLGLVWASEREHVTRLFFLEKARWGRGAAVAAFLGLVFLYGWFAQAVDFGMRTLLCVTLVVSLLHFWYDGFVWSVQRREV